MTQALTPATDALRDAPLPFRARLLRSLEAVFPVNATAPAITGGESDWEFRKAAGSYGNHVAELGGIQGKTVLDFGCGWGGESVWLAQQGAAFVDGCDINEGGIADAQAFAASQGQANVAFACCTDRTLPYPDARFDAIFSTNVFEHVMHPVEVLSEIRRVLKPGGSLITTFGPLFHGPLGYHLCWATQVPWAHLLFGFDAVIAVRNTKRTPFYPKDWEATGLNRITFDQFRAAVREAGLEPTRLRRMAVKNIKPLAAMPVVGKLFTFGVDCRLTRSEG